MFVMARSGNEILLQNLADEVALEVEQENTRAVLATKVMAFARVAKAITFYIH